MKIEIAYLFYANIFRKKIEDLKIIKELFLPFDLHFFANLNFSKILNSVKGQLHAKLIFIRIKKK